MGKASKYKVVITKTQLVDIAINSIRTRNDLSTFWEYVKQARDCGLLNKTDEAVKLILKEYEELIYGRGFELQEADNELPDRVSTYELGSASSGTIEQDYLSALTPVDITPLRREIPEFINLLIPKPVKVILIDSTFRVTDSTNLQPLFKVVAFYDSHRRNGQLYIIGRDRHTGEPFALGVPNGFIDKPFEACLRWTLDAHRGDEVIEV